MSSLLYVTPSGSELGSDFGRWLRESHGGALCALNNFRWTRLPVCHSAAFLRLNPATDLFPTRNNFWQWPACARGATCSSGGPRAGRGGAPRRPRQTPRGGRVPAAGSGAGSLPGGVGRKHPSPRPLPRLNSRLRYFRKEEGETQVGVGPPWLYEAGGKRDGRCPWDEGCFHCVHGVSSRALLTARGEQKERGKTRQNIKTPQTPQTLQNKDKKGEKKIQILPALFHSHFAVQQDSITFGRPVPEKGRCCVSDVSGEVFPLLIWGFVSYFYALLWGRRVPEQSSLNPAPSGSERALPISGLGCCKGEKRKDKRRNPREAHRVQQVASASPGTSRN
ncbi:uncharacterized protein LOC128806047 [Vidua macroura]|uniref:uncharacterized protein LOC128806047 n=1 Tax=Vidua macroura TaxID=187451 RepID=UPI0023A83E2B|nr:uncharacterized protein LOC128806047 [Vidua macroura]